MILPACLGILLVGIVMIPGVFAAGGCGEGTVLVDGVCQLAPVESSGCGQGTVMVNGVCQLAESSGTSIPPMNPVSMTIKLTAPFSYRKEHSITVYSQTIFLLLFLELPSSVHAFV